MQMKWMFTPEHEITMKDIIFSKALADFFKVFKIHPCSGAGCFGCSCCEEIWECEGA